MPSSIPQPLITLLRSRFRLDWHGIHGAPHWARVRRNGLLLAERSAPGASTRVIELFAFLHDSCRHDDGYDPLHGQRAADSIAELAQDLPRLAQEERRMLGAGPRPSSRCRSAGTRTGWTWEEWGTSPTRNGCARRRRRTRS